MVKVDREGMLQIKTSEFRSSWQSFNMTPIIDIVFLLIIFFLVVCQFIDAENFPVSVPQNCEFALDDNQPNAQFATVTVMKANDGRVSFAVGAENVSTSDNSKIAGHLAKLLDVRLENLPVDKRIVTLRIDKDVCFSDAQYALSGIAASTATDVRMAVLKKQRSQLQ
ncbi:MAG: biopolymer transporter ExbD [Planctomycetes bacterium]|nr:biopolymer transporter ExbD [Planctomycetota bacterium]